MFFHKLMVHCHFRAVAASVVPPASFKMRVTSSVSKIENCGFSPTAWPSARNRCTPRAWKVQIRTSLAALPMSFWARSRISAAALLVKVIAAMCAAGIPV